MLKRLTGFSDMRVGMVGALPFLAAFVTMQVNGWHSDKRGERRWHAAMPLFVAGIAYFFLSVPSHSVTFTIGWFTVAGVLTAYLPTFWAIPTEILSQAEAATAVGLINSVGSIAGFIGPYIFGYVYTRTGASFERIERLERRASRRLGFPGQGLARVGKDQASYGPHE